jgi:pseudaminic acid biosynthesis-associated methylase
MTGNSNMQLNNWIEQFGKEYTDRNDLSFEELEKLYKENYGFTRTELNTLFLDKIDRSKKILEIGSNIGNQLLVLQKMGFKNLYGIEPQEYAIQLTKDRTLNINIIKGDAFNVPFKDEFFDIVFTSGVLIHIHKQNIKKAIREIYRCSNKYIWGFEYYADKYTEIPYRGQKNLLWKANFPKIYMDTFPDLKIVKIKFFKYLENNNIDVMYLLRKNV